MRGIILNGGYGTRLRPFTHTRPKQLFPIANKPMSQYVLEDLKNAGITDIGIVVSRVHRDRVEGYYGTGEDFGVKITYICQDPPKGISHAIGQCRDFVGEEKFVVCLGDNILQKNLTEYMTKFVDSDLDAMILLCSVDDPQRFGIAEMDEKDPNKIKRIVEKPRAPESNLAVIGIYFLTSGIFDVIDTLKPSWRGELEITDALDKLLSRKDKVGFDTVTGWWKDAGTPDGVIHANKLVLDSIVTENRFTINLDAQIRDKVIIGKDSCLSSGSSVVGPAMIGKNCRIGPGVRIGPYVSIGDNCRIRRCKIDNSIIMEGCTIDSGISFSSSIIAYNSEIFDSEEPKKRHEFFLGEGSCLKI